MKCFPLLFPCYKQNSNTLHFCSVSKTETGWIYAAVAVVATAIFCTFHYSWNECCEIIIIECMCVFANSNKMPWQTLIMPLWDCSVWITCERLKCICSKAFHKINHTRNLSAELFHSQRRRRRERQCQRKRKRNRIERAGVYFVTCELDFQY